MIKYKKSAALLIVMVLIAVIITLVAVAARSAIASILFSTNSVDNMTAEEASKAGIEVGLLTLKSGETPPSGDQDLGYGIKYNLPTVSPTSIISIGKMGRVQIKHTINQSNTGGTLPALPPKTGLRFFVNPSPGDPQVIFGDVGKFFESSIGVVYATLGSMTWTGQNADNTNFPNLVSGACNDLLRPLHQAIYNQHPQIRLYVDNNWVATGHLFTGTQDRGEYIESSISAYAGNYYATWTTMLNGNMNSRSICGTGTVDNARARLGPGEGNQDISIHMIANDASDLVHDKGVLQLFVNNQPKGNFIETTITARCELSYVCNFRGIATWTGTSGSPSNWSYSSSGTSRIYLDAVNDARSALKGGQNITFWAQTFADVLSTRQDFQNIENIYYAGITSGCGVVNGQLNYCPDGEVTRGQTAAFLAKAKGLPDYTGPQIFSDVPTTHLFFKQIGAVSQAGIDSGCGDGKYCPANKVTRAQAAVFIAKAKGLTNCNTQYFGDVKPGDPAFGEICAIAKAQITGGCGGGNYCPTPNITRAQMAVFIDKAFLNPP